MKSTTKCAPYSVKNLHETTRRVTGLMMARKLMKQRIKGLWRIIMDRPDISSGNTHRTLARGNGFQWIILTLLLSALYGCGNSASNGTDPNKIGSGGGGAVGVKVSREVQAFWDNLHRPVLRQHCVGCHEPGGPGTGDFANKTDIQAAYNAAISRVNLDAPNSSLLVTKVAGNHNCWDTTGGSGAGNCPESAKVIATAIANWKAALTSAPVDTNTNGDIATQLDPPVVDVPPNSQTIVLDPTSTEDQNNYNAYIYGSASGPAVSVNCSRCHSKDAAPANRQTPYFANLAGATPTEALATALKELVDNRKIDLNTPENSRIYLRLQNDKHNCWSDCGQNATTMLNAIYAWQKVASSGPAVPAEGVLISQALTLTQGQVVTGGNRYSGNLIALWEFKAGTGTTIADTSGVPPAMDLELQTGNYSWVGGYGIEFKGTGTVARASASTSQKLYDLIVPLNEYSVEAWVVPANVSQEGPAVIASYSTGGDTRNFTLGQTKYSYEFLNRNTAAGVEAASMANGNPTLITNPDDEDLQATLQHVVMTYSPATGRKIYVNGKFTGDTDTVMGGDLTQWDDTYTFEMGAESNNSKNWLGKIRLMAIYNRALTQAQITQNFEAGVGQTFNLLFRVGGDVNGTVLSSRLPTNSYIWMQASQFDDHAYWFANPKLLILDPAGFDPANTPLAIEGMRIGINGKEAPVGQGFLNLKAAVNTPLADKGYVNLIGTTSTVIDGASTTVPISAAGTVIELQNGPDVDQFYLTFKNFDGTMDGRTDSGTIGQIAFDYPAGALANVNGIRTFEEINATMSELTEVSLNNATVRNVYLGLTQQLPGAADLQGFLASNQISIAKMAASYCSVLVDTTGAAFDTKRTNVFGSGTASINPDSILTTATGVSNVESSLYAQMVGNVSNQMTETLFKSLIDTNLIKTESLCPPASNGTCDSTQSRNALKSMCTAALSSAAVTMQ